MRRRSLSIVGLLKASRKTEAQGRLRERQPVSIIDIGSNSVRQVIYEGLTRSPSILFNEKVLCGLGRGVAQNGKLEDAAVARALGAIRRFQDLSRQTRVGETHILATAAVRDARNGKEFMGRVEEVCGTSINLLSGEMEAEYASLGIKSGFYEPEGIVGDLGGGSMELVGVNGGKKTGVTTPLGGLRLHEMSGGNIENARKIARKTLKDASVKWPGVERRFYAIGGTWRSLARLHMFEADYPLDVVHDYTVAADEYIRFCKEISGKNINDVKGIDDISGTRKGLVQYGAVVLAETLKTLGAKDISMSALGLREGYLYSLLDEESKKEDALLEASAELAVLRARSPEHSQELAEWTSNAFSVLGLNENKQQKRYRIAACNLADIAWRSAVDYRAEQTLGIINNAGFTSINHEGRAYLAIVSFHRYQGLGNKKTPPAIAALASRELHKQARVLAAMFRVLYLFSASVEGVLPHLKLEAVPKGKLVFHVPGRFANLVGEKPELRIEQFAREIDREITVEISR